MHLLLDVESVAEICRAVRQRVGPGIMLMVDTHMRQTVASSMRLGRELEKLNFTCRPGLGVEVDEAALERFAFPGS